MKNKGLKCVWCNEDLPTLHEGLSICQHCGRVYKVSKFVAYDQITINRNTARLMKYYRHLSTIYKSLLQKKK